MQRQMKIISPIWRVKQTNKENTNINQQNKLSEGRIVRTNRVL